MINKFLGHSILATAVLYPINTVLAVEALPSTMIVVGRIQASSTVSPTVNDAILAKQDDGTVAGQGVVSSDGVSYSVIMSKTNDFNGTKLTLQLKQAKNGAVYGLLDNNNPFAFGGGFPASQLTMNPTIGNVVSQGSTDNGNGGTGGNTNNGTGGNTNNGTGNNSGGSTGGTTTNTKSFDVNGDGKSNQSDIDVIKQELAHGSNSSKADINGDGIVNTRDVIDAIKQFRKVI